jgi:hypothetical protein
MEEEFQAYTMSNSNGYFYHHMAPKSTFSVNAF